MDSNVRNINRNSDIEQRSVKRRRKKLTWQQRLKRNIIRWYNKHIAFIIFGVIPIFTAVLSAIITIQIADYVNERKLQDYGREKCYVEYQIQGSDTLWDIACEITECYPEYPHPDVYINEICHINNIHDADSIKSGDVIILPYYKDNAQSVKILKQYNIPN